jgi:hypothetical protein
MLRVPKWPRRTPVNDAMRACTSKIDTNTFDFYNLYIFIPFIVVSHIKFFQISFPSLLKSLVLMGGVQCVIRGIIFEGFIFNTCR